MFPSMLITYFPEPLTKEEANSIDEILKKQPSFFSDFSKERKPTIKENNEGNVAKAFLKIVGIGLLIGLIL